MLLVWRKAVGAPSVSHQFLQQRRRQSPLPWIFSLMHIRSAWPLQDGGLAMTEATSAPPQTVEDIRRIVNGARTKAAPPPVGIGAEHPWIFTGWLLVCGHTVFTFICLCSVGPSPARVFALEPSRLSFATLLLQPAVRDFNEEDYMDGDLMDEELVE